MNTIIVIALILNIWALVVSIAMDNIAGFSASSSGLLLSALLFYGIQKISKLIEKKIIN